MGGLPSVLSPFHNEFNKFRTRVRFYFKSYDTKSTCVFWRINAKILPYICAVVMAVIT